MFDLLHHTARLLIIYYHRNTRQQVANDKGIKRFIIFRIVTVKYSTIFFMRIFLSQHRSFHQAFQTLKPLFPEDQLRASSQVLILTPYPFNLILHHPSSRCHFLIPALDR